MAAISDTFTSVIDGNEVEFTIQEPTLHQQRESQKIYNQAFSDAVNSGSIVRARLDDLLKEQGLWDDQKEAAFAALQTQINDQEQVLAKGGISLVKARSIALELRELREKMRDLISIKTNLDTHTAEGQADNAKFNYLVSRCLVYKNSKKPYFSTYEDYLNRSSDIVGVMGAQKLAAMMYGLDSEFEKKLPENKFLLDYKFVNEDLRFIDKEGRFTDQDGRLIDKNGRYINEKGEFVDKNGALVNQEGNYVSDFKPFTDESGKPVILDKDKKNDTEQEDNTSETPEAEPAE
tara:strand:- start:3280 stop:4152 length:873 start_codon:yes stop_codon:yes gene_type:complete